jgi:VTC domain
MSLLDNLKQNLFRTSEKMDWERLEAKYVIPTSLMPGIREFIRPFCVADPHGKGDLPEYEVTTLQLDDRNLTLYKAREEEYLNRFKLRVRTYGTVRGSHNVYMEIKRKIKNVVVKSRCTLPSDVWCGELITGNGRLPAFRSSKEKNCFFDFIRVVKEMGCEPKCLIRYVRESYFGVNDRYARLTFDRRICYMPVSPHYWDLWPQGGKWWAIDSQIGLNRPFSGVILELKTYDQAPLWMMDLVREFNLVRAGFCKYGAAMRLDSLFNGAMYSDGSETTFRN